MDEVTPLAAGPVRVGSEVRVRQPKLRPAVWTVLELAEDAAFVWRTGGRGYEIVAGHYLTTEGAATTVRLTVAMSGLLAPALWPLTGATVRRYVEQEAAALKAHCEAG